MLFFAPGTLLKMANVFLFVPNIIGYIRIVLVITACYHMQSDYVTAIVCYALGVALDEIDGYAARYLNQGTRFGELLDLITDCCSNMCISMGLAVLYPDYALLFQFYSTVTIAGHWMHTQRMGWIHHKLVSSKDNWILYYYYNSSCSGVMFALVYGNEGFFCTLYLLYHTEGPKIGYDVGFFRILLYVCLPLMLIKTFISCIHLIVGRKVMLQSEESNCLQLDRQQKLK
ncbi:CDP-diacylglycerol--inositol 3-phosphatidyltransferase-like [Antedon mediterranea]|uniref:CDP-diacylglycerol--inositol 3-phosphatidyltransferase-like n=1 Tax=Antedon mediterranea TaxID=105859 RepID=UPI003AF9073D